MRITLFMTMSLNGMTSRPDYREDFLSPANWHSFLDCTRETGALIWGRKTHEKVLTRNRKYLDEMGGIARIVVSSREAFPADAGFEHAVSPTDAVARLERRGVSRATLAGGSILNTSFVKEGLIDDLVVNVEAVAIGRGIPLFAPDDFDLRLELRQVKQIDARIVQLQYEVRR